VAGAAKKGGWRSEHTAIFGSACPVAFVLIGGQRNAPQADVFIDDFDAEVVMTDAAYDSDRLRRAIDKKGALAVICFALHE